MNTVDILTALNPLRDFTRLRARLALFENECIGVIFHESTDEHRLAAFYLVHRYAAQKQLIEYGWLFAGKHVAESSQD